MDHCYNCPKLELQDNLLIGKIPDSICQLETNEHGVGSLKVLTADCSIECTCCTSCT